VHSRQQQQQSTGNSQQNDQCRVHCAVNTKTWTNGVTLN
jgi:hypothetical protein